MRSGFFVSFALLGCVAISSSVYAQSKTDKVDRLHRFFNVEESIAHRLRVQQSRTEAAGREAVAQYLNGLPASQRAPAEVKAQETLEKYVTTSSSGASATDISKTWKAFLMERLTDEEIDTALAFFSSPTGGKFMGVKGVADSFTDSEISRHLSQTVRPAFEVLKNELQSIGK
jgi:hypothetical protein